MSPEKFENLRRGVMNMAARAANQYDRLVFELGLAKNRLKALEAEMRSYEKEIDRLPDEGWESMVDSLEDTMCKLDDEISDAEEVVYQLDDSKGRVEYVMDVAHDYLSEIRSI